jgi:hypothetical protein
MRMTLVVMLAALAAPAAAGPQEDALLKAVRAGDVAAVKQLLESGVPADTKYRYDRTALSFAADRGNREIVELLLAKGADVNAKDTFYGMPPLVAALQAGHVEIVKLLLAKGAEPALSVLSTAIEKENAALASVAAASGKVPAEHLSGALSLAERDGKKELAAALRSAGVQPLAATGFTMTPAALGPFVGVYKEASKGWVINLAVENGALRFVRNWPPTVYFEPTGPTTFRVVDSDGVASARFELEGDRAKVLTIVTPSDGELRFARVEDEK